MMAVLRWEYSFSLLSRGSKSLPYPQFELDLIKAILAVLQFEYDLRDWVTHDFRSICPLHGGRWEVMTEVWACGAWTQRIWREIGLSLRILKIILKMIPDGMTRLTRKFQWNCRQETVTFWSFLAHARYRRQFHSISRVIDSEGGGDNRTDHVIPITESSFFSTMSTSVKLYVYDLSNGMAKSLSRQLTGRQIDGIW